MKTIKSMKAGHTTSTLCVHIVWAMKYRGNLLHGLLKSHAEYVIRNIIIRMGAVPEKVCANGDHVHVALRYPPKLAIDYMANQMKGASSRILRLRFPWLKKWCSHSLWQVGYHPGSVGHGAEMVFDYIDNQGASS